MTENFIEKVDNFIELTNSKIDFSALSDTEYSITFTTARGTKTVTLISEEKQDLYSFFEIALEDAFGYYVFLVDEGYFDDDSHIEMQDALQNRVNYEYIFSLLYDDNEMLMLADLYRVYKESWKTFLACSE